MARLQFVLSAGLNHMFFLIDNKIRLYEWQENAVYRKGLGGFRSDRLFRHGRLKFNLNFYWSEPFIVRIKIHIGKELVYESYP